MHHKNINLKKYQRDSHVFKEGIFLKIYIISKKESSIVYDFSFKDFS